MEQTTFETLSKCEELMILSDYSPELMKLLIDIAKDETKRESFKYLKEGDFILQGDYLCQVGRVTNTQVVLSHKNAIGDKIENKFNNVSGWQVGESTKYINHITPASLLHYMEEKTKLKARSIMQDQIKRLSGNSDLLKAREIKAALDKILPEE